MDNKNIFEKSRFSKKKLGIYIVAALCIGAIAFVSYLSFQAINANKTPDTEITDPVDTTKTDVTEPVLELEPEAEDAPTVTQTPEVTVSAKDYIMPVENGEITAVFSIEVPVYSQTLGDWRIHDGIDISAPLGAEVVAVNDGIVESIECHDLYGVTVVLKHTDGKKTTYSNLEDSVELEEGQVISQGDIVGKIGETAVFEIADGPHLHLEMSQNGKKIDPAKIIKK